MTMQQIASGLAVGAAENLVNENFDTLSHQAVYGKRPAATTALVWGYYGGRWGGASIADGTVTLTDNSANYLVVDRSTGTLTASSSGTNWGNTVTYARVYKVTTSAGLVAAVEDHRAGPGGAHGGPAFALVTVSQLPTASSAWAGHVATVSDATATTYLSTVAGGGSNKVPVRCTGTAWVIG